jgi:hypothetical protein
MTGHLGCGGSFGIGEATPDNKSVAAFARRARSREHGAGAPRRQRLNVKRHEWEQQGQRQGKEILGAVSGNLEPLEDGDRDELGCSRGDC